jgi:SAM-dependent methyltransferase
MPSPSGYDAELRRHNQVLHRAVGVQFHDHVLDVGCGAGQTTREAARTAQAGSAFGVDVSAPAIGRARGRLAMMVWQAPERNEREVAIRQSLGTAEGPVAGVSDGPDPFSLADPPTVKGILQAAGFAGVAFTDVREPVCYGPDVAAALDWVSSFRSTSEALKRLDPAAATRAVGRLREVLATHLGDDGVWFSSRAWIVTARPRPASGVTRAGAGSGGPRCARG